MSSKGRAETVRDSVTISYRGASYGIGRGPNFYGIWTVAEPGSQPLAWWPDTADGWYAAWARFTEMEVPGTIAPLAQPVAVAQSAAPVAGVGGPQPVAVAQSAAPVAGVGGPQPVAVAQSAAPVAGVGPVAVVAAALLATGVASGIVGLFPHYLNGASLAQQPDSLVPHVIYLAVWSASALLILLGGSRLRMGALLGTGASLVTFGLFFADAGTAMAGGAHVMGAGLVLGLVGWLACFAGSVTACVCSRGSDAFGKPRGPELVPFLALTLAALGAAAAFAPSWDSYVLQTSAGARDSLTAGNVFSNPAPVIAGNVMVMVVLVAVVVAAALWRPILHGAALLAGALSPMIAQAISALIQIGEHTSPTIFGISSAEAARAGLTITSGLTLAFWIYCFFVLALTAIGGAALLAVHSSPTDRALPAVQRSTYGSYTTVARPTELSPLGPLPPRQKD
jgi:hypothetical protein